MKQTITDHDIKFSKKTEQAFTKISKPLFIATTILFILAAFLDTKRALFNYHLGFSFLMSVGLGGLFLAMLQHVTNSGWSIVIRRVPEAMAYILPLGFVLMLPMFLGSNLLFHWSNPDLVSQDHLLSHKALYLNDGFFMFRTVLYFCIWTFLFKKVIGQSTAQDHVASMKFTQSMMKWSAIGMVLFGFSITFAATDWMMSLKAAWFSTIYGVYYFSGTFVVGLALTAIFIFWLQSHGHLKVVNQEHFHDIGKLLYAMNIFWAYIAFSQFMLIWYANIPEETVFFADRANSAWPYVSMVLMIGHFGIPFFAFMSRHAKRNRIVLLSAALWLVLMHYVDLYWLIMPNYSKTMVPLGWIELVALLWSLSAVVLVVTYAFKQHALIPMKDPRLQESLEFHQV
jgi:hypothetical protein